jgi:Uma2 family endonuclease
MLADENKKITFEEFLRIDEKTEEQLEYIDGVIYNQASPSTDHQRIVSRLHLALGNYFYGKTCEAMVSPYDIILKNEKEKHKIQPDISIICDEKGFTKNNYVGSPTLVIEVLSPSTSSRDLITKMNLYMRFGIKEYWIVSPKNKEIQIYNFEDCQLKQELTTYRNNEILFSNIFENLKIDLSKIFPPVQ